MLKVAFLAVFVAVIGVAIAQSTQKTTTTTKAPAKPLNTVVGDPHNLTFVISGRDLPNGGKTNKLDAYAKVFHRVGGTQDGTDWTPIGNTDVIKDESNPSWTNVFWFIWKRGTNQVWHFEVKDKDVISRDDSVGFVDVPVDMYVEKNQDLTVKLNDGGSLIIKKTTPINFRLYARNLPKKDSFGGASDPFVECYWRYGREGNDTLIGTTATIDNVENADFVETFEFSNYQKGTDQWLHLKVWDYDSVSGNDDLGECFVEADPFQQKRAAKVNKLSTAADNKGTLTITPA